MIIICTSIFSFQTQSQIEFLGQYKKYLDKNTPECDFKHTVTMAYPQPTHHKKFQFYIFQPWVIK